MNFPYFQLSCAICLNLRQTLVLLETASDLREERFCNRSLKQAQYCISLTLSLETQEALHVGQVTILTLGYFSFSLIMCQEGGCCLFGNNIIQSMLDIHIVGLEVFFRAMTGLVLGLLNLDAVRSY